MLSRIYELGHRSNLLWLHPNPCFFVERNQSVFEADAWGNDASFRDWNLKVLESHAIARGMEYFIDVLIEESASCDSAINAVRAPTCQWESMNRIFSRTAGLEIL